MRTKREKTLFLEQFGDTPQIRVIDFMIGNHFFDFPLTEIARGSNVSYNSLKSFIDRFLKTGFLIKTRKVRKSDYYQLNLENDFVKNLMKLDWMLTKSYAQDDLMSQIVTSEKSRREGKMKKLEY